MNAHRYGGALNALSNFWFTKIDCADTGLVCAPETHLTPSGAVEPMLAILKRRVVPKDEATEIGFTQGFEFAMEVARVMLADPFGCEQKLRELLDWEARDLVKAEICKWVSREKEAG